MLRKIFFFGKEKKPLQEGPLQSSSGLASGTSRALKIIHPGGRSEKYYMAVPAARIIEQYPAFILARPEVFHKPWDTIVRPDEMLVPGQKYLIVPRQTVKKLRRRIRKGGTSSNALLDNSSSHQSSSFSTSGILVKPGIKVKARDRHVRFFFGNDKTNHGPGSATRSKKKNENKELGSNEGPIPPTEGKKRRVRNENLWEPSLDVISENI